jgi:hypothetical protein
MTSDLKLPFGLRVDTGKMVSVDAVLRGLSCECVCPACHGQLVAAKGDIVRHHFRHHAEDRICAGALETVLHLMAKQILCERMTHQIALTLPDAEYPVDLGTMESAASEVWLDGIRPDVLAQYAAEPVAIEVHVTHRVTDEKISKFQARKLAAMEIDLKACLSVVELTEELVAGAVLEHAPRRWLFEPACVRAARREHQGPCLQELVAEHGGYDKITQTEWARYEREMAGWQVNRRVAIWQ